jgi:hypothetical protein
MVEHQEIVLPIPVQRLKQIIAKLGDYSTMEEDEVVSNIGALANLLVSVGKDMYMYVCIYVRVCVYICMYVYAYSCKYMFIYMYTFIYKS